MRYGSIVAPTPADLAAIDAAAEAGASFEHMTSGGWYRYRNNADLESRVASAHAACHRIASLFDVDRDAAYDAFHEFIPAAGPGVDFSPPFSIDYGECISIGARTFLNMDFLALGGGLISIGEDCLIGPSARLYTPNHAVDPSWRRSGYERVRPITIGNGVWMGGSVVLCPGVTIGDDCIIGAGSVVTHDIPAGSLAAGNPARVVRSIAPGESR